ncbi:MAG TPA: alpha/beta fold hydrolase [Kiritimatiellia bacterium]|nr:alpha/beta fold hydrolase [Kiritimatiellia bacterium]HMP35089.1 alpha/beta fold hydrolase [Kiritimatiellia bacterium]
MRKSANIGVAGLLFLLAANQIPAVESAPEGVILLHGLARTTRCMEPMAEALRAAGFIVVNQGYPSRSTSISNLTAYLDRALDDPALATCPRIHLVTHSMGGILVRLRLTQGIPPRLGRHVMLGPPNQGSEVVDKIGDWAPFRWINGPAGQELGTGPTGPASLGPARLETGIIAGRWTINGGNSLMIPGPDDGKVSVERTKLDGMKDHVVLRSSHPFLMKNREAIALTIRFLQTGSFSENHSSESKEQE